MLIYTPYEQTGVTLKFMKKEFLDKIIVKGARTHNLKNINVSKYKIQILGVEKIKDAISLLV